jgi:hypothetical protein
MISRACKNHRAAAAACQFSHPQSAMYSIHEHSWRCAGGKLQASTVTQSLHGAVDDTQLLRIGLSIRTADKVLQM